MVTRNYFRWCPLIYSGVVPLKLCGGAPLIVQVVSLIYSGGAPYGAPEAAP